MNTRKIKAKSTHLAVALPNKLVFTNHSLTILFFKCHRFPFIVFAVTWTNWLNVMYFLRDSYTACSSDLFFFKSQSHKNAVQITNKTAKRVRNTRSLLKSFELFVYVVLSLPDIAVTKHRTSSHYRRHNNAWRFMELAWSVHANRSRNSSFSGLFGKKDAKIFFKAWDEAVKSVKSCTRKHHSP